MRCPDCFSETVLTFARRGDGRCAACRGTGVGGSVAEIADETDHLGRRPVRCDNCAGSGTCPTCRGTGEVDEGG